MTSNTNNRSNTGEIEIIGVEEYQESSDSSISSSVSRAWHNEGLETIQVKILSEEKAQKQYQNSWQYISSVIFVSCATFVVMTVVPTTDIIRFPEYWWELMVQWSFGYHLMRLIFYSVHCRAVLNYPNISSPRSMLTLFIFSAATLIIYSCVVHLIWTTYLGYYEPMALNVYLEGLIGRAALMVAVWYQFPTTWRNDPNKRRQLKYYFFYWTFELSLIYHLSGFLIFILPNIPNEYKPYIVALVLILWREGIAFVMSALIRKAASGDQSEELTEKAVAIMNIQVASRYHFHVFLLCTYFSSDIMTFCLLGGDLVFVLVTIAKIFRLKRKDNPTSHQTTETRELITELITTEFIENMMPILFMITFTLTYNGPNAYHMEGMRYSYWQQPPVKDLVTLFYPTSFIFFGFDLLVLICSAIFLYFACNVNMIKEAKMVLKNFGFPITLNLILLWTSVG